MSAVNQLHSPRLFVSVPLAAGDSVALDRNQSRYLGTVLRLRAGAHVRIFNGRDGEWLATFAEAGNRLDVAARLRPQATESDTWLLFAPLRRDATELIVQKATELGVAALLPVLTARTQPARLNAERLAAITREAAEQSERLSVPRIEPARSLADLLAGWETSRRLSVAVERLPPPAAAPAGGGGAEALLIGPEGGFAPAELELLARQRFVRPVSLGALVLRAETAAIAGLALLQIARAP